MEKTKIYTQTVVSCNLNEWEKNPDHRDELCTVEHRQNEMTEAQYEKRMKDQKERKVRLQNLIVDMMIDYIQKKKTGLIK